MSRTATAGSIVASIAVFILTVFPPAVYSNTPEIEYPSHRDRNGNRIADDLESEVASRVSAPGETGPIRIVATLYSPPSSGESAVVRQLGGTILHLYSTATYGFAAEIPADRVLELANALGGVLCFLEADRRGKAHLDDSARHIRARPLVWNASPGYGLNGDINIVVGIFDSGIDATHVDLTGRVGWWKDFTVEAEPTVTDRNGHGSHVAGIVAGTGFSLGSGSVSSLTTTMSGLLPATNGLGFADMIKVAPGFPPMQVTLDLVWTGVGSSQINLAPSVPGWLAQQVSATSPNTKTWNIPSSDVYKAFAGNNSGAGNQPYSMLVTYPYTSVGDGHNLFRGVAPLCGMAGFKILKQDGTGWASEWEAAFDTLAAVNAQFNIKVANASVGLNNGDPHTGLHNAVNGCVSAGTVVVISAGNDYGSYYIGDPGLAEKAITVGAINDMGAMTDYSSNGSPVTSKPDVVAPGGAHSWNTNVGSEITSTDTNVNDAATTGVADRQANDYQNLHGTSMAAPHVAGVAALVINAMETYGGLTWVFSEANALTVKMLILMTATETNRPGEESSGNNPPLNRGGKDRVEGYGKVNADAAVEAVINSLSFPPDTSLVVTFGNGSFDRQCWAAQWGICGPDTVDILLSVPPGADYDLYLYESIYGANGEPQIAQSSTQAGAGIDETFTVEIGAWCIAYYVVAKRVSGSGAATLTIEKGGPPVAVFGDRTPSIARLQQNYPNPFGTNTTLTYSVPGSSEQAVTLSIYDARGALVRQLVNRRVAPGVHRTQWDGFDNGGRRVSSGIYFARLDVTGTVRTVRMTMLR